MAIGKKVALVVGGSGFLGRAIVQAAAQTFNVFNTHRSHLGPKSSIKFDLLKDDAGKLLEEVRSEIVILTTHIEPSLKDRRLREHVRAFLQNCGGYVRIWVTGG